MYRRKWACVSWWFFSPPCGKNDKHQEWKNKMHVKVLCQMDRWPTKLKGCTKLLEMQQKKHMECDGMNKIW